MKLVIDYFTPALEMGKQTKQPCRHTWITLGLENGTDTKKNSKLTLMGVLAIHWNYYAGIFFFKFSLEPPPLTKGYLYIHNDLIIL